MTQREIGKLIGVTYQQIHKYEHGINRISAGLLHAIAQALGVEVDYFFVGLDDQRAVFAPSPQQLRMLALARDFDRLPSCKQEVIGDLARNLAGAEPASACGPEEPVMARMERSKRSATTFTFTAHGRVAVPG